MKVSDLSKQTCKTILKEVAHRGIQIGTVLSKQIDTTIEYDVVVGMSLTDGKIKIICLRFYDILPTSETLLSYCNVNSSRKCVLEYILLNELKDYSIFSYIKDISTIGQSMYLLDNTITFNGIISTAEIKVKARLGTLLEVGVFESNYELIISMKPYQVIEFKAKKIPTQKELLNILLSSDNRVLTRTDEERDFSLYSMSTYVKSYNENFIRQVILKLRLIGKLEEINVK